METPPLIAIPRQFSREPACIHRDAEIMGGEPVFSGTREPVRALRDYLIAGHTLDEFLAHFQTVERACAVMFLRQGLDVLADAATPS